MLDIENGGAIVVSRHFHCGLHIPAICQLDGTYLKVTVSWQLIVGMFRKFPARVEFKTAFKFHNSNF